MGAIVAVALAGPPVQLSWKAPDGCSSSNAVRDAVDGWLEDSPARQWDRSVRADVVVSNRDGLWTAAYVLESHSGRQERRLQAHTCETLANAIALELALAVDPSVVIGSSLEVDTARAPPGDAEAQRHLPTPQPASPRDAQRPVNAEAVDPAPAGKLRGLARMQVGVATGVLPRVGPGLAAAVGLRYRWLQAELRGLYWFERPARYEHQPAVGGDLQMGAVGLALCPVPQLGRVEFPICAEVQAGAIRAEGVGVSDGQTVHRAWAAAALAPSLAVRVSDTVALRADVDAMINLLRPAFGVQGLGPAYRVPALAIAGMAGVEVRFP